MVLFPEATTVRTKFSSVIAEDEEAMDRLGGLLASALSPGDVVTVSGPLGAGKSHLCRALIRARLRDPSAEVPSPSYTLVNVYSVPHGPEIWHADLYRVADPEELGEIGLVDAADHAIVLVEWPERWANLPARRLALTITPRPDEARLVSAQPHGEGWERVFQTWERFDES